MTAADLSRQLLAENVKLLPFRRANVRREISVDRGTPPLRSEENQFREAGGGEPGEAAAIASPAERQAPVAVKPVPAHLSDLETLTAHGLHRVPEERLYFTYLHSHVRCRPSLAVILLRRDL